jgi:hypothetical protein
MEKKHKVVLFGGLYFVQRLSEFMLTAALSVYLFSEYEWTPEMWASFGAAVMLPWVGKILLAPVLDIVGRYRHWIIGMPILMGATLFIMPFCHGGYEALLWLVLIHNIFRAVYDLATDASAVNVFTKDERGLSQAAMWTGGFLGKFAGGAGAIWLTTQVGWGAVCTLIGVITLTFGAFFPFAMHIFVGIDEPERPSLRNVWQKWKTLALGQKLIAPVRPVFDLLRSIPVSALLLALSSMLCMGFVAVFHKAYLVTLYGAEGSEIAQIEAWQTGMQILGFIVAGLVMTKVSKMMVAAFGTLGVGAAYLILSSPLLSPTFFYWWLSIPTAFAEGVYFVSLTAVFMDATDVTKGKATATVFAGFMALMNSSSILGFKLGGASAGAVTMPFGYYHGFALQLVTLVFLGFTAWEMWWRRRRGSQ